MSVATDLSNSKNTASAELTVTVNAAQPTQIAAVAVTIAAPVLGAEPQSFEAVQTATKNDDYTVTGLTWSGDMTDGKFKAGQVYTATLTLTSKNSKKFQAAAFSPTVAKSASVGETTTTGADIGIGVTLVVPCQDIVGSGTGADRVLRGGSWGNSAGNVTVAIRHLNYPSYQGSGVGFRVVRP